MDVHRPLLALTALLLTLTTVCLALPVEDISGLEHVRPGLTVYRAYARARSLQLNEIDSEEVGSSSGASKAAATSKSRQPPRNTTRRPPPPPPPAAETGPAEDVQTAPDAPPTSIEPEVVIQQTPTDADVEQSETQLEEAAKESLVSAELAEAVAASPVDTEQTEEIVEQKEAASEGATSAPSSDTEQSDTAVATADPAEEVKAAEENTIVSANAEVAPVETVVAEDASVVTVEADAAPVQLTVFTAANGAPADEGGDVASADEAVVGAEGAEPEQTTTETAPTEATAAEEQQVAEEIGAVDLVPELFGAEEIPEESAVGAEEVSEETAGGEETTNAPVQNTEETPVAGLEEEPIVSVAGLEEEPVSEPVPVSGLEEEPVVPVSGLEEEPVVPVSGLEGDYVEEDYVDPIGAVEDYVDEPDVPTVDSEVPVQEGEGAAPSEDTSQYTVQTSIGDLTDSSVAEVQQVNDLGIAQVGEGAEQFGEGEEDLGLAGLIASDPAVAVTEPYDLQTGSDTLAQQNALDEQDILADVI